jgi:protein gp37
MASSAIEWTDFTWNPIRGCARVSPGCERCYAERQAHRMNHPGGRYEGLTIRGLKGPYWTGSVRLVEAKLDEPLHWRKPRRVFVNSMSDLFHEGVPDEFISRVFDTMHRASHHQFQILTKRSERLCRLAPTLPRPARVWMGVSVESEEYAYRMQHLRRTPAAVRFLSLEPLLGPLGNLDLTGIAWVIVGGESGPGARTMEKDWVVEIRDQCLAAGVPFFFKQWGGVRKGRTGRSLEGRTWDEMPESRPQYPAKPMSVVA